MPTTLDKSRPFTTIFGHAPYAYRQDGKCFLSDGRECDREGNLAGTDAFGLKPLPETQVATPFFDDEEDLIGGDDDEPETDDLDQLKNKELRRLYTELTDGDKLRVGLKNDYIRKIIRALRRGETPEAA